MGLEPSQQSGLLNKFNLNHAVEKKKNKRNKLTISITFVI